MDTTLYSTSLLKCAAGGLPLVHALPNKEANGRGQVTRPITAAMTASSSSEDEQHATDTATAVVDESKAPATFASLVS